jgi:WS/DGAT C-terminal domain
VNLVVTNVAGPPVPLYLAGARLLELFPMMPVMGNLTLVVGALSYAGSSTSLPSPTTITAWTSRCSRKVCAPPSTSSPERRLCPPREGTA